MRLPVLERLEPCKNILIAGAGGGFDVFAGLPLYEWLVQAGKTVHLASLSFSELKNAQGRRLRSGALEVLPDAGGDDAYFPERYLSEWFARRGMRVPLYCFHAKGAVGVKEIYEELLQELQIDALVLADGGTDSLMRGDEPGLGSPAEDMVTIAAVQHLGVRVKLLVNLGFGVDVHHGVCHAYVLEAVAELTKAGGFLGAFSLLPSMPEFQRLQEAVDFVHAKMPGKESIVMSSVVAAGRGEFGDFHPTRRTEGSKLFLNPLLSMYWCFELEAVAQRCLYLDYLRETYTRWDVHRALNNFLYTVEARPWLEIPI